MTRRSPTVSIGMPVYNGERFVRESLDSILAQTYTDFELIISDNASTDMTEDICRDYVKGDSRIRYYRNEVNLGAAKNFNLVFMRSTGKYFRWSSADDLFAPNSLKSCLEVLDGHPEVVLCYPKTILIDENGKVIRPYEDNLDLRSPNVIERFRKAMQQIGLVNAIYGLIRSDSLSKTSLMGSYPGSDIPLLLELTLYGTFWEIQKPLFFRRLHSQASSTVAKKSVEHAQYFIDPQTQGKLCLRHWRHQYQNLLSITHATITYSERVRLLYILFRSGLCSRQVFLTELSDALRHMLLRTKHTLN